MLPIRGRYLIEHAHEAHSRTTIREPQLKERLSALGEPDPVSRANEVAAPPAISVDAKRGSDLGLVTVGLDNEGQADAPPGYPTTHVQSGGGAMSGRNARIDSRFAM